VSSIRTDAIPELPQQTQNLNLSDDVVGSIDEHDVVIESSMGKRVHEEADRVLMISAVEGWDLYLFFPIKFILVSTSLFTSIHC